MALVTGDISYDFSGLPDQDPYTNSDFTQVVSFTASTNYILNGALTLSGVWRTVATPTSNVIKIKVQTDRSSAQFHYYVGGAIIDASGNGYALLIRGDDVYCRLINAGVIDAGYVIRNTTVPYNAGDDFYMQLDVTTGAISIGKAAVELAAGIDATYSTNLHAAMLVDRSGGTAGGIISFASDGYSSTVVTAPASAKTGDTVSISTVGLGTLTTATIADSNGNTVDVFSNDTQIIIPNFNTAGQQACLYGTVTLTVGDGTDTAQTTFTLDPATGFTATTASGLTLSTTDPTDWNYGSWTSEPVDGDQVLSNDAFITHNADGSRTFDPADLGSSYSYTFFIIDAGNGIITAVTTNFLNGGVISSNRVTAYSKIRSFIGIQTKNKIQTTSL